MGAVEHQQCGFGDVFLFSFFSELSALQLAVFVLVQGGKGLAEGQKCLSEETDEAPGGYETGHGDQ